MLQQGNTKAKTWLADLQRRCASMVRGAAPMHESGEIPSLIGQREIHISRGRADKPSYHLLWQVLVDHLVGTAEQVGSDGDAESLCGLEVDEQVNFRGLLDR